MILLLCGLSGAGKTTLAGRVKKSLSKWKFNVEVIDADEYREKLFKDLSFTREDRFENIRRLGFIANRFSAHGIITLVSAINPYEEIRRELTETYKDVKVVHVDCPLEELVNRDTKGLYKRAMLPEDHPDKLKNLTGYNDPFEAPTNPDLYINTKKVSVAGSTDLLCAFIIDNLDTISTNKPIAKELVHA